MDVVVVGAGPAGLAAAAELRRVGVARVLVVEREAELGGIPRHSQHAGFGWFDLGGIYDGPDYARARVRLALDAGCELVTETTATGWDGTSRLLLTSPRGRTTLAPRAVLLATGCRERPRAARLVPGSRPLGVFTTGALQQLVMRGVRVGERAVVVGAEHVSYSAVHTLRVHGVEVVLVVTEHPAHQTIGVAAAVVSGFGKVRLRTRARVAELRGRTRLESVIVCDLDGRALETVRADTVVFTGDFIPDHELAREGGVAIDLATRGPRVDGRLRTSVRGVFAAGNVLRGAEMADVAALEGRAAAHAIRAFLTTDEWPKDDHAPLVCASPLAWICPSALRPDAPPPRNHFVLRTTEVRDRATLVVRQGAETLATERVGRIVPNRTVRLGAAWIERAAPYEPIVVSLADRESSVHNVE